jgi:hypothetical protein
VVKSTAGDGSAVLLGDLSVRLIGIVGGDNTHLASLELGVVDCIQKDPRSQKAGGGAQGMRRPNLRTPMMGAHPAGMMMQNLLMSEC